MKEIETTRMWMKRIRKSCLFHLFLWWKLSYLSFALTFQLSSFDFHNNFLHSYFSIVIIIVFIVLHYVALAFILACFYALTSFCCCVLLSTKRSRFSLATFQQPLKKSPNENNKTRNNKHCCVSFCFNLFETHYLNSLPKTAC